MSLAIIMVGALIGLLGAYVVTSLILLKRPGLLHKKKKNVIYAQHISHRGGAGERIENTMAAFQRAMSLSTDMLELDCHLLLDGDVVVSHDSELSRLTGVDADISDFTFNTLPLLKPQLELTFSPDKLVTSSYPDERNFVRLEDVFRAFPSIAINIDIKVNDDELIAKTFVWVCNKEHHIKGAFNSGATGVMTDYPSLLRAFLDNNTQYRHTQDNEVHSLVVNKGDIPLNKRS